MDGPVITLCSGDPKNLRSFDGARFAPATPKEARKGFCAAVLPADALHSHTFKVPVGTAEEKLETIVEITMYEEGGLDLNREYAIAYVKHPLEFEASWLIEAFAAEREALEKRYASVVRATGHIDLLAVPYLVYEALYATDRVEATGTDLFLYLGEEASYAVLCKEGRYIAQRSLPSLASIALKADVTTEVLEEALRNRGLDADKYGPDERLLLAAVQEAFAKIAERVTQTVNHKRGIFGFDSVDSIRLDFGQSEIPGLWELLDGYGFEESRKSPLACCESLAPEEQHEGVEALYLLSAAEGKLEAPNLTIFERRTPFLKTHTGRFVAAVAASVLLLGVAGFAMLNERADAEAQVRQLQQRHAETKKKYDRLAKALKAERERLDAAKRALEKKRMELLAYDEAADTMALIEASKRSRQKMMRDVDRALAKYRLTASSLEQNGSRRMAVDVMTPYDTRDRIAKFMQALYEKGYGSVQTRSIERDGDIYRSRVEVVR